MAILVLNAGSSSLKFGLFDGEAREELAAGLIDWRAHRKRPALSLETKGETCETHCAIRDYAAAVRHALDALAQSGLPTHEITAVGHRIVQGGKHFRSSVLIDGTVKKTIRRLIELAPLHNPPALETIEAAQKTLPDVPHVAVFDTAFYHDMPPSHYIYPLPYEWYSRWGMRRFGFHGISYAYCAPKAAEILGRDLKDLRMVACHLGNGCSATAIEGGVALATTMGLTPLEGLMMGTRAGSVDPGILLYVQRHKGLSAEKLWDLLNNKSGLLGISGVSADYRQVLEAARKGHLRARLALEIYATRVRAAIGALTAMMGKLDALIFTAGVGEHASDLRVEACKGLVYFGLRLDPKKNTASLPDSDIAAPGSSIRVLIIHTREELMIACEARRLALGNN
jgi:acetate kinase